MAPWHRAQGRVSPPISRIWHRVAFLNLTMIVSQVIYAARQTERATRVARQMYVSRVRVHVKRIQASEEKSRLAAAFR